MNSMGDESIKNITNDHFFLECIWRIGPSVKLYALETNNFVNFRWFFLNSSVGENEEINRSDKHLKLFLSLHKCKASLLFTWCSFN